MLKGSLNDDKLKKCAQAAEYKNAKSSSAAVDTSFVISQIIANNLIQFTDGDYVKECMMKAG